MDRRSPLPIALAIAAIILSLLCLRTAGSSGAWYEELATYPMRGAVNLELDRVDQEMMQEAHCAQADPPTLVSGIDRPHQSLCLGGWRYPVMVTSYASGYLYWPSALLRFAHGDDVFWLRGLSIFGALVLLVGCTVLVRRFAGDRAAAVAAIAISTCPPVITSHSVLVQYETLPLLFIVAAALVVTPKGEGRALDGGVPGMRSVLVAALCLGLAVAANIKGAFIIGVLGVYALWIRMPLLRVPLRVWLLAVLVASIPLLPMLIVGLTGDSFSGQVTRRAGFIESVSLQRILREPMNLTMFWTDVGGYGVRLSGGVVRPIWPAVVLVLAALAHSFSALMRARNSTDPALRLAGSAAALLVGWMLVSILLYTRQRINYAPLHAVFAISLACALVSWSSWLQERYPRPGRWALGLLLGTSVLLLGGNALRRSDPSTSTSLTINAVAQRALVTHLLNHTQPGEPVYTTTYNMAGVPDSLSRGELSTVRAHRYLNECRNAAAAEQAACVRERWLTVLGHERADVPMWVVLPARFARIEEPTAALLEPCLQAACDQLGLRATRVKTFTSGGGVDVLALVRVGPGRPAAEG